MTKVDPYLHATLLLYGAGKEISEVSIVSVLKAAGIDADNAKAKFLAEAVKDVNIEELLKNAATVVAPTAGLPTEAKKEEKKEEDTSKKEEQAAEGLASLFG